jgi:hypothetical protein
VVGDVLLGLAIGFTICAAPGMLVLVWLVVTGP